MATVETPNRINLNKDEAPKVSAEQAPAEDAKPKKPKAEPRDYSIVRRFSGKKEALHKAVDEMEGDSGVIFVVLGHAKSLTTKGAMEVHAKDHDLSGKYETVADSAFTEHNVKTEIEQKRRVSFA